MAQCEYRSSSPWGRHMPSYWSCLPPLFVLFPVILPEVEVTLRSPSLATCFLVLFFNDMHNTLFPEILCVFNDFCQFNHFAFKLLEKHEAHVTCQGTQSSIKRPLACATLYTSSQKWIPLDQLCKVLDKLLVGNRLGLDS